MKCKLDENLDHRLAEVLSRAGHDADTVLAEGLCGHDDGQVYEACLTEDRTLLTLDLDFSNPFRFPPGPTAGIVVLRPHRPVLPHIMALLLSFIPELARRHPRGATWIVEPGRIRVFEPNESTEAP